MANRDDILTVEGVVVDKLPNAMFRIKLAESQNLVTCTISGKIRQHDIKILLGDRVLLELSIYDLTKGRIKRRL